MIIWINPAYRRHYPELIRLQKTLRYKIDGNHDQNFDKPYG